MPIITVFNSKGGSAKSTTIALLADAFARQGASVSVIDTDRQRTTANWLADNPALPIRSVEEVASTRIHQVIRREAERSAWVFIDTAGFSTDMRTPVMSRADLVIVPMQASPEDARMASEAFALIRSDEETLNKPIHARILWARTVPNFPTKVEKQIQEQIAAGGVPTFQTHLHERSAYKAIFGEGQGLAQLQAERVTGLQKAVDNADTLAAELAGYILSGV